MKYILLPLFVLLFQSSSVAQPDSITDKLTTRIMVKEKMLEDFNYLRKILEETHPGLYRYNTKELMQRKMDSLADQFNHDMPFYDYYLILTSLISDIRCAHTYVIPKKDLGGYLSDIKILPFEIIPIKNELYISLNGTLDTTIKPGYEILSINGKTVDQVLQEMYRHIWADGFIQSSKTSQITGTRIGFYYYIMVERPDSFLLHLRNLEGKITEIKVPALLHSKLSQNLLKNPVNLSLIALYKPRNQKERKNGWRLEILDEPSTALIRINSFGGGKNGEEAIKKIRKFMDENMTRLKKKNIRNLIIDLRNNGGGWDGHGVELFTYLMKDTTPVRYYARKHTITDSSEFFKFSDLSAEDKANAKKELIPQQDGTFTLKEDYNQDLKLQYPKPNRFTGNVYFLVNGGSGSSTSEFTAVAHSHRIGIFIGDETGGAYEGDNSGSFLHFQLPNSGISVGTPLIYYNNGVKTPLLKGRGVIPDHYVFLTKEALLNEKDPQMEFALELIRKNK